MQHHIVDIKDRVLGLIGTQNKNQGGYGIPGQ
jgi:hypothetical protein